MPRSIYRSRPLAVVECCPGISILLVAKEGVRLSVGLSGAFTSAEGQAYSAGLTL